MVMRRVRGWVGAGLAEAGGRLVILLGTTAYLARLLGPDAFGTSALVLSFVGTFGVCVGTPYEEALAQRRVVRRIHLEAALAASLALALLLIALSVPIGWYAGEIFGDADFALLLPAASGLLLLQAPLAIATGVARRRRAFYRINMASLIGHVAGASFGVALALGGAGVWALIGLRAGIVGANAVALVVLMRLALRPAWSWPVISELSRFAVYIFLIRLVENLTFLIFNAAVGGFFGLFVLGQVNMAMRLIEPVRGAVVGVTYNLCFSLFKVFAQDHARLGEEARRVALQLNLLTAPVFMGLAAVTPLLIPLLAGPGWEASVPIAVMLAAGSMTGLSSLVIMSALSVAGMPRQILYANSAGLAGMVLVLVAAAGRDAVFVGLARAVSDTVQTLFTVLVSGRLIQLPGRPMVPKLVAAWIGAAVMALLVTAVTARLGAVVTPLALLPLAVACGVASYGLMLFAFARTTLRRSVMLVLGRGQAPVAAPARL